MSRLARGLCQHSNSLVLCWACLPPLRPGGLLKHKLGACVWVGVFPPPPAGGCLGEKRGGGGGAGSAADLHFPRAGTRRIKDKDKSGKFRTCL